MMKRERMSDLLIYVDYCDEREGLRGQLTNAVGSVFISSDEFEANCATRIAHHVYDAGPNGSLPLDLYGYNIQ